MIQKELYPFDKKDKDIVTKISSACAELRQKGYIVCGFRMGETAIRAVYMNHAVHDEVRARALAVLDAISELEGEGPKHADMGTWLGIPIAFVSELATNQVQIVHCKLFDYESVYIDERWLT